MTLRPLLRGALGLVLLVAAAGACDERPSTPEDAWAAIRTATETADPVRLLRVHDSDTVEHRRQVMRQFRALLQRGDAPERALGGTKLTPDEVLQGTLDEAVGRLFAKHSPLVRDSAWFLGAKLEGVDADGTDAAKLRLRGADDQQFALWLVREGGGWVIDHRRTWLGK